MHRSILPSTLGWIGLCLFMPVAGAQHHGAHGMMHGPTAQQAAQSPYAGLQRRQIKALSEQQIADLRAGRGMGLALAAELNGYPGPMHTLELAEALRLTPEQRSRVQALYHEMRQEAMALGEEVIEAEQALDRLFRDRQVTKDGLSAATARAAAAWGRLREMHLRYHLEMMEILDPEQVARYAHLRGY